MYNKFINELSAIIILSVILIIGIVFLPTNCIRIILGLPFVLFFPGYTLISALYPNKRSLSVTARVAFAFGMSTAVVLLMGLILNFTPWGINLYPMLTSLSIFITSMSTIAFIRRNRLPASESFNLSISLDFTVFRSIEWQTKVLLLLLGVSTVMATSTIVYVISTPKEGESLTEFYIVVPGGKAESYPRKIQLGESASVIVGIANHEQKTTSYRISINMDNNQTDYIKTISLLNEGVWEQKVAITPTVLGDNQKVEFDLYKDELQQSCLTLHLWLNVSE